MAKLTFTPVEKKILEINGEEYEVRVTDIEVIEMIAEFEDLAKALEKKRTSLKPREISNTYKTVTRSIDKMLGDGALEKIMGTSSLPTAKIVEVFQKVSDEIVMIYEADARKLYE